MASEIRVNKIINRSGLSTVTFTDDGAIVSGIVSASVYTGSGANLTDLPAGNLSGTLPAISATNLTNVPAANITGTLPAISAANLTSIPAANLTGTVADARISTLTASKLSGALPAIDGSSLTGVGASFGNSSVNTSGIVTATAFVSSEGQLSNRNKIINGDFTIHQRGGTIASSSGNYTIDRWRTYRSGDSSGGFSVQQSTSSYPQTNLAGVIDNFKSSAFITVTSAGSAAANNNCKFQQRIEGSHVYDLAFGTAVAKKVTVSFYVKCSLTGNFGVALVNGAHNRSNVQLYTVNSASTWERKIVTFDGDTSGTWLFNTDTGLQLMFDMGSGSSKHAGSTGTWLSGEYHGTTSSVKLIHTNGATWQTTGVQLEAGSVATPFEFRNETDELQRCQRYYQTSTDDWMSSLNSNSSPSGYSNCNVPFKVQMRAAPTVNYVWTGNSGNTPTGQSTNYIGVNSFSALSLANSNSAFRLDSWTCSAEL